MTARKTHSSWHPDLSKGSLPVVIVVTLLSFVAYGAYTAGSVVRSLENERDAASVRFANIEKELSTIRSLLEQTDYVRTRDLQRWCTVSETLNKGWKCPDIMQLTQR